MVRVFEWNYQQECLGAHALSAHQPGDPLTQMTDAMNVEKRVIMLMTVIAIVGAGGADPGLGHAQDHVEGDILVHIAVAVAEGPGQSLLGDPDRFLLGGPGLSLLKGPGLDRGHDPDPGPPQGREADLCLLQEDPSLALLFEVARYLEHIHQSEVARHLKILVELQPLT